MAHPSVAIIIPTFNGVQRVPLVLKAIRNQVPQLREGLHVIVVDNASTDGCDTAIRSNPDWIELLTHGVICEVKRESRPGLTYARIAGVLATSAEIICFLDDDNIPAADYLHHGMAQFKDETVGLVVSRVSPHYLAQPTAAVQRRSHLLAINDAMGDEPVVWEPGNTFAPTLGAGMWVRRSAFLAAIPYKTPERLFADRQGSSLRCGGDIEIGFLVGQAGFTRTYCPNLRLDHMIPAQRVSPAYIRKLILAIIRSQAALDERYLGRRFSTFDRLKAIGGLILRSIASPVLLMRKDGINEVRFVLTAACARVAGPYRD